MNIRKKLVILLLIGTVYSTTSAQKGWYEYIQQKRVEFLIVNLELPIEESQNFWPVYNEYYKKKNELSNALKEKYGDFKKFEGTDDEEYRRVIEGMMKNRISQAELLNTYNEKYLQILPAEKVFRLYQLEEEFNKNLMRQIRIPPPQEKKRGRGAPR